MPLRHRRPPTSSASHRVALRLQGGVDTDLLAAQLRELCCGESGLSGMPALVDRRRQIAVALSVVETCGRSRAVRESDAFRLVALESSDAFDGPRSDGRFEPLRATLVSVDASDHFLLLDAPPARGQALLQTITTGLGQLYPIAALAPA